MTVLCTDKTGTLTSAEITLARSLNSLGIEDPRAARLGAIAADLGGDRGALDAALVAGTAGAAQGWNLVGRHAFDFNRRLGSVLASGPEGTLLIVKGVKSQHSSSLSSNATYQRTPNSDIPAAFLIPANSSFPAPLSSSPIASRTTRCTSSACTIMPAAGPTACRYHRNRHHRLRRHRRRRQHRHIHSHSFH